MEEKKRFHPTLTQYRALEQQLDDEKAKSSQQQKDIERLQRELHDARMVSDDTVPKRTYEALMDKNRTLEQSNSLMASEISMLRSKVDLLDKIADDRADEVQWLKGRTLWQRIVNVTRE